MADEQEQIDALKKWWRENGTMVVGGVVIGLGAMGGWNWWQARQQAEAEAASAAFSNALVAVSTSATATDTEAAAKAAENALILSQDAKGAYAPLAALAAATIAVEANSNDAAIEALGRAIDAADDDAMRSLAHLRLARVLLASGDADGAAANLDLVASSAFSALADELRGDIAHARDDADGARERYQALLDSEDLPGDSAVRLRLKLDALGRYTTPPDAS